MAPYHGGPQGAYACICAVWSKGGGRRAQAAADAGPGPGAGDDGSRLQESM
jgi:hypothetical protein